MTGWCMYVLLNVCFVYYLILYLFMHIQAVQPRLQYVFYLPSWLLPKILLCCFCAAQSCTADIRGWLHSNNKKNVTLHKSITLLFL